MAGKKTSQTKTYSGTKAQFIRSQPKGTSAQEVVDKAKALGMVLTRGHVYAVKSATKKARRLAKSEGGVQRQTAATRAPRVIPSAGANRGAESQLRKAIADIGIVRATEILESVRSSIMGG